jgi:DNA-binding transcriptional regulator GbsR (MarR family)
MKLTPVTKDFIVHWGEMGTKWGINRTVAQIHALLHLSPEPLSAEEITGLLMVARSNVSNSLKELENWGLTKVTHIMGDRKERYECMKDVWEMFRVVLDQRKKREIDPTLEVLRNCVAEMNKSQSEDPYTRKQIMEFLDFLEIMTDWYNRMRVLPIDKILEVLHVKKKITQFLRGGKK